MNQIILFAVFIFFGIFIYYIIKEQCKCDIVEGQGCVYTHGGHQLSSDCDPEAEERRALDVGNDAIWLNRELGPCNPVDLIPAFKILKSGGRVTGRVILGATASQRRDASIIKDCLKEIHNNQSSNDADSNCIDNETNSGNPYSCILENKGPIHSDFLSFSLEKVLTHLNNYLMSAPHPNGICLKNEDRDLTDTEQIECVNAITKLALSGEQGSEDIDKCCIYDSCKNMFNLDCD